ncbi:MAG: endonuclease, partial [Anaerotignum sp.]
QIAKLEKEADAIRDKLKADMEEKGLEEMCCRDKVIRWRTIQTNRLDGKALQKALPEIYKQFLKPCTSRRFTIV